MRDSSRLGANFTRGRKFSSDELQLMLLALLENQPSHGYELVKALRNRSGGYWSPSPGMVYPALTYLYETGYAAVTIDSNKKSYALLPDGLEYLATHREQADELLATLVHMARKMKYIQGAMAADNDAAPDDGWLPDFVHARLALKRALLLKSMAGPAEQKRITAILEAATRQINQSDGPQQ
ncbi:MAG: PadR family transcriptional regulator [Pusillimonas sp.]